MTPTYLADGCSSIAPRDGDSQKYLYVRIMWLRANFTYGTTLAPSARPAVFRFPVICVGL